jgi:hypothetical protein
MLEVFSANIIKRGAGTKVSKTLTPVTQDIIGARLLEYEQ